MSDNMKIVELQITMEVAKIDKSCNNRSVGTDVVSSCDVIKRTSSNRPINGDHLQGKFHEVDKLFFFSKKESTYIVVTSSEIRGSYVAIDCRIGASNPSMNGDASLTRGIKVRGSQRIEILKNDHLTSGWIACGVKDENDFFGSIKWLLFAQFVRIQVNQVHSSSCVWNERPSVNLIVDCNFLLNFKQWPIFSW